MTNTQRSIYSIYQVQKIHALQMRLAALIWLPGVLAPIGTDGGAGVDTGTGTVLIPRLSRGSKALVHIYLTGCTSRSHLRRKSVSLP